MLPFLVGDILIVIYRHRLADAFEASNRAFYGSLLGEDRPKRLEGKSGTRRTLQPGVGALVPPLLRLGLDWPQPSSSAWTACLG
jgi:hypothetical protein